MNREKAYPSRLITIAVILVMLLAMLPLTARETYAASRPAQVKAVKITKAASDKVSVTWKKASGAKKYQVYLKYKGGKYKKIKTVKGKKAVLKVKNNKQFYVKVRGIKGKRKGRFSKAKGFVLKKKKAAETTIRTLPVKATVSGNVVTVTWEAADPETTYWVSYGRNEPGAICKDVDRETSLSFKGIFGDTYGISVSNYRNGRGADDVRYEDVKVTIPESNDPTPPKKEYVDQFSMSTKEYLEKHVYPDLYAKYQYYNGSNTDQFEKLKNMLKAMHALCCYGYVHNNRFFSGYKQGTGADPDTEFTPPDHVKYSVGCESATMCMLYLCRRAGLAAFAYYPGHAYPLVKTNGVWHGSFADATWVLSRPGSDEDIDLSGYHGGDCYRLGKQFTDAAIKDVFSLTRIYDLEKPREEIVFRTGITWGGYHADYYDKPLKFWFDINRCQFEAVDGDTDIITFDNEKRTFSTHGTGRVKIRFACGKCKDAFWLEIKE